MQVTASVTGMREIAQVLKRLPDRAQKRVLNNSLRAGARVVQRAAKENVPVSTIQSPMSQRYGHLRDNIRVVTRRAKHTSALVSVTSGRSFWGKFLEFGTSKMPPKPWLRPAADENRERMTQAFGTTLGRGIDREAMKLAGEYRTARRAGL